MHPSPVLDALFWEHVVARQRQLRCAALRCRAARCDDVAGLKTEADSARLGLEPQAPNPPEKLRAA